MDIVEVIIKAAALISAVAVIVGAVHKSTKPISDRLKDIDELKAHTKDNYMNILRLTIMNKEMPISERLIAGEKYVSQQGNGEVKATYEALAEQYKDNYREMMKE